MQSDQQLLATILEHTHMLVAYLDTRFDFVRVNRAYAQADGKDEAFFPGKNHFDLYPNSENAAIFRQVLDSGTPYFAHAKAFEYSEHPERGVTYWDWSLVPTKAGDGTVTGLVLTLADVTKVVETRESLRRERDLAAGLLRTAQAIILELDTDGNIVTFNPYLEELSGVRLADAKGRSWLDMFVPPDERSSIAALFKRAISGIETRGSCNSILTRDGGKRTIQWFDTTLRDARGEIRGLLAVGIDNTELMSSQQHLMLFKSAVHASNEAIAIADRNGRILFVNEAHQTLYGYREADVVGRHCLRDFVETDSVPAEIFRQMERGECVQWEGEARAVDRHGRCFPVWMRFDCAGPANGATRHYVLLAHDITEQKRSELRRLTAERHRHDAFVRELHHRIKNHLQGVIGLLQNSMNEAQARPGAFDDLVGKISALAGVYDISARHEGQALPLFEIVRRVVATVRDLPGQACPIELEEMDATAGLLGDEAVPITLVLNELMTNACKHGSGPDAVVRVRLERNDAHAAVTVTNPGSLPEGFSFAERAGIGMGLSLIHSLLPRDCALLRFEQRDASVVARLLISAPLLVVPAQ